MAVAWRSPAVDLNVGVLGLDLPGTPLSAWDAINQFFDSSADFSKAQAAVLPESVELWRLPCLRPFITFGSSASAAWTIRFDSGGTHSQGSDPISTDGYVVLWINKPA